MDGIFHILFCGLWTLSAVSVYNFRMSDSTYSTLEGNVYFCCEAMLIIGCLLS